MTLLQMPLRVTVPTVLVLVAVISGVTSYIYTSFSTARIVEREGEIKANELQRVRNILEIEIQEGDEDRVRRLVADMGSDIDIIEASLIDDKGKVIAATDLSIVNSYRVNPDKKRSHPLAPIIEKMPTEIAVSYPVSLSATNQELRPSRIGFFNVRIDMERRTHEIIAANRVQASLYGTFLIGLALVTWIYFHFVINKRVTTLQGVAQRFGTGDLNSRAQLNSNDEFGELARTFNRMADKIAEQQGHLRALQIALDHHAIVSITDVTGRITYVNNRFCAASRYSREELLGQNHRIVKSGAHDPPFYRDMWRTIASGNVWQGILQNKRKDGKPYWVQSTIVPIIDEKGKPSTYISVRTDVTQRERLKQAMETLATATAGEDSFDTIAAAVCQGLDCRWAGFGQLSENDNFISVLGYWNDGGPGKKFSYHVEGTPCEDVCRHGKPLTISDSVVERYPNDPILINIGAVSYRGEPLITEDGRVFGVLWAVDDHPCDDDEAERALLRLAGKRAVLELNRAKFERTLRENEHQLGQAQRMAKLGSWTYDVKSGALQWSDEVFRIFELDPRNDSPSYEFFLNSIHPDDRALVDSVYKTALANKRPYAVMHRLLLPDGRIKWVQERGETSYDGEGNPLRTIGYIHDITTLKESESERVNLRQQLQHAQKMEVIGQLTGGIAHDFNNLLAAIIGFTELSIARFANDENSKLGEYLKQVLNAGYRGRDLVLQMLAFGRSRAGEPQALDAAIQIKEVTRLLKSTLPSSIELKTLTPNNVPAIVADPVQLHQVVSNLAINARDAAGEHGSIEIGLRGPISVNQICSSCHKSFSGKFIEVYVKDNGSGIPPDLLTRIFEPFFTTKQIGKGSGMGLSMVHGIMHQSAGHILVDSVLGAGSNFRLLFPLMPVKKPAEFLEQKPQSIPIVANKHLLIVDDEPSISGFVSELLNSHGYKISTYTDSNEALRAFASDPDRFDLLITDQTMPHLTGIELAHQVLTIRPAFPIILCTGYSAIVSEDSARRMGITAFIRKPYVANQLLEAIASALEHQPRAQKRAFQ